nr:uncharacterized protein LOC106840064 [Equus asinus]
MKTSLCCDHVRKACGGGRPPLGPLSLEKHSSRPAPWGLLRGIQPSKAQARPGKLAWSQAFQSSGCGPPPQPVARQAPPASLMRRPSPEGAEAPASPSAGQRAAPRTRQLFPLGARAVVSLYAKKSLPGSLPEPPQAHGEGRKCTRSTWLPPGAESPLPGLSGPQPREGPAWLAGTPEQRLIQVKAAQAWSRALAEPRWLALQDRRGSAAWPEGSGCCSVFSSQGLMIQQTVKKQWIPVQVVFWGTEGLGEIPSASPPAAENISGLRALWAVLVRGRHRELNDTPVDLSLGEAPDFAPASSPCKVPERAARAPPPSVSHVHSARQTWVPAPGRRIL